MPASFHADRRCAPPRMRLHRAQSASQTRGFTLLELMITVAIVAILAAIAIPSYYRYILRSNRSAAESVMQEIASAQEHYMIDSRQFAGSVSTLGYAVPDTVSANYRVVTVATSSSVSAGTPPSYTVTAMPQNSQLSDTDCGTLTLKSDGSKLASGGAANCWK